MRQPCLRRVCRCESDERDRLERNALVNTAGEVAFDLGDGDDVTDHVGGADEVGTLERFERVCAGVESDFVEGAVFVLDKDDAGEGVGFDEEFEFVEDAGLFKPRLGVAREAGGTSGQGNTVVVGQAQAGLEEVIVLLGDSAVGAVDRSSVHALGLVGQA